WLEDALVEEAKSETDDTPAAVLPEEADDEHETGEEDDEDDFDETEIHRELRVSHPIKKRADVALHALLDELKAGGHFPNSNDEDLGNFVGGYMTVTAKLAGALGGFERDHHVEPGLVIAWLKRVLEFVNETLAAADRVATKPFLAPERLDHYRRE